jgi:hypothetical protein
MTFDMFKRIYRAELPKSWGSGGELCPYDAERAYARYRARQEAIAAANAQQHAAAKELHRRTYSGFAHMDALESRRVMPPDLFL